MKISVIMPVYNGEKYLREAIDSILNQTYTDFEFIIINDCSTDDTEKIILSYQDERIIYLKNDKNLGVAATLNRGLDVAKGEYIARMDADDISLPQRLQKQVAFLDKNSGVAVLGCSVERFCDGESLGIRQFSVGSDMLRVDTLFGCPLAHPSVMLRRVVIWNLGGYDVEFEGLEDYALWWKVSRKWDLATLQEVLLRYRVHPGQVTQKPTEEKAQRMLCLKKRQLEELGLYPEDPLAQNFYDYCMGNRPKDAQSARDFCLFLEKIITANEVSCVYRKSMLRKYLTGIAHSTVKTLPLKDAFSVSQKTKLIYVPEFLLRRILRSG